MKRLILFLIVFALCLFCGCTTSNNEEKQQNSTSESISEIESSLSSASIYESSVSSEPGSAVQSESSSAPPQSSTSSAPPSSASSSAKPPASSSSSSKPSQKNIKAPNDYYVSLDYYLDSGFYGNKENAELLSGTTVDTARIIPVYSMKSRYNLMREQSEVDAFLQDYDNGVSISDMCEQSGTYYAALSDGNTAYLELKNGVLRVSAVGGSPFKFDFPSKVSNYDGNAVSAKNLAVTRLLRGILISDGNKESFIVLESLDPFDKKFKTNTLYPISDIVEFIRNNKDYGF
mgnify:CR=1 FL=1